MLINNSLTNSLISQLSKEEIKRIENLLQTGEVSTINDLILEIQRSWRKVNSFASSTTVVVPDLRKGELPLRSMLEEPFLSAENDINTSWQIEEFFRDRIKNSFNLQRTQLQGLKDLLGEVQNKASRFQLFISDTTNNFLWSSDSFTSLDKINLQQTTATIDTSIGQAYLQVTSTKSLSNFIEKIDVDRKNSVGVPGNNLVINQLSGSTTPENEPEPQPVLENTIDYRSNIISIFDGQPDTWFEWEYNFLPRKQKLQKVGVARVADASGVEEDIYKATGDKGWGWKKYIAWPGETDWDRGVDGTGYPIANFDEKKKSKFVFTVTLDQAREVNTIEITPNIIGGIYPHIRNILISQDGKQWKSIAQNVYLSEKLNESLNGSRIGLPEGNYSGIGLFQTNTDKIKYIKFDIEANGFYSPKNGFGHKFYYKVTEERSERNYLFFSSVDKWIQETRLPNPEEGIKTSPEPGTLINGKTIGTALGYLIAGPLGGLLGSVLGGIGGYSHSSNLIREGTAFDIFKGERSVIAIRDIALLLRQYSKESQIVSQEHLFLKPIEAVSIISTEEIPDGWDTKTEWIQYFLSTDGTNWQYIVPQNRINNKGQDTFIVDGSNKIYVKILISRNEDLSKTPIVKNYTIKALPV